MTLLHARSFFASTTLSFFLTSLASASGGQYDASLNTLPTSQGWSYFDTDSSNQDPTVSGGILYQGPTTVGEYSLFERNDQVLDFSGSFSASFELKIDSSSYVTSPFVRGGYSVNFADLASRTIGVVFASDRVFLMNSDDGPYEEVGFDTTSGFHIYDLTVDAGIAKLAIDGGSTVLTAAVGGAGLQPANRVFFGDGTVYADSSSQLKSLSYAPVPEPASLSALALGAASILRLKRKRDRAVANNRGKLR